MSSTIMTASRRSSLCVRLRTACNFAASTTPLSVRRSRWLNSTIVATSLISACGSGHAQDAAAPAAPATTPAPVPPDAGQENPATPPKPVPADAKQDTLPPVKIGAPRTRRRPVEPKPAAPREIPRARKVTSEPPKATPSATSVSRPRPTATVSRPAAAVSGTSATVTGSSATSPAFCDAVSFRDGRRTLASCPRNGRRSRQSPGPSRPRSSCIGRHRR